MAWTIEFDRRALHELRALDRQIQRRLLTYLEERIAPAADPRQYGEALTATFAGLWRYRVGDYRIVCRIEDAACIVLVVRIGHRREVYIR